MQGCWIRDGRPEDQAAAYYVCLKTGDHGGDGEPFYQDDPDALGRIYVGPYLHLEPELSLILEDDQGVCGYAFGALDSQSFYERYDQLWRPGLCREFAMPQGDPSSWTRAQRVHALYHHPDYFCPQPYDQYPSHMHIDLLARARGVGFGRKMMELVIQRLKQRGSPGGHLGVSVLNSAALTFYAKLGFHELVRVGNQTEGCVYLGKKF
jgi:ribosomal protein S18 acetylase RimI-like enzyme